MATKRKFKLAAKPVKTKDSDSHRIATAHGILSKLKLIQGMRGK